MLWTQGADVKNNLQVARLALGEAAVREGKYEEAMELYEQVKTTQGIWNLAQVSLRSQPFQDSEKTQVINSSKSLR